MGTDLLQASQSHGFGTISKALQFFGVVGQRLTPRLGSGGGLCQGCFQGLRQLRNFLVQEFHQTLGRLIQLTGKGVVRLAGEGTVRGERRIWLAGAWSIVLTSRYVVRVQDDNVVRLASVRGVALVYECLIDTRLGWRVRQSSVALIGGIAAYRGHVNRARQCGGAVPRS